MRAYLMITSTLATTYETARDILACRASRLCMYCHLCGFSSWIAGRDTAIVSNVGRRANSGCSWTARAGRVSCGLSTRGTSAALQIRQWGCERTLKDARCRRHPWFDLQRGHQATNHQVYCTYTVSAC